MNEQIDGFEFYLVADGREYVGNSAELTANDGFPVEESRSATTRALFGAFEAELSGEPQTELLDAETQRALEAFLTLKKRFPEYRQHEELLIYIERCRNQLAAQELYVGQFYMRTKHYKAAITRMEGIFKEYPNYYERDKVFFYLGQAYFHSGDKGQATEAFNRLFKEFPGSEFILNAQKFIDKNY